MSLVPTTDIISPLLKKTTTIFRQERNKFKSNRFTFQHPEDTLKFGSNGFTGKVMFVSLYIKQKVTHTNQNESLEKDL